MCVLITSCASNANWQRPSNKKEADTYNDMNECVAMGRRVAPSDSVTGYFDQKNIISNCMKGKGYTEAK
jgi:hypothetical protein